MEFKDKPQFTADGGALVSDLTATFEDLTMASCNADNKVDWESLAKSYILEIDRLKAQLESHPIRQQKQRRD